MTRRLRAFSSLPAAERRRFVHAWLLLLYVRLRLSPAGFRRLRQWASRMSPEGPAVDPALDVVLRTRHLVGMAARHHIVRAGCLHQALAVQRLLSGRGIQTVLRIGVRRAEGLAAHAWLEYDGRPVGEPGQIENRFAPLAAPGRRSRTGREEEE